MGWRSKRAMRIRAMLWIASVLVVLPLFWAGHVPPWAPFALIALWTPILISELCQHCGVPLIFKGFNPLARRPICPNCNEDIV